MQKPVYRYRIIVCIFSHHILLPQLLKCDTDMVVTYRVVATLLATLLCLDSYEQRSTQLLKMLHKCCNTDVLGVLLIYLHSPSGLCIYISVKPLAAVLQPINIHTHTHTHTHTCKHTCTHTHRNSQTYLSGATGITNM